MGHKSENTEEERWQMILLQSFNKLKKRRLNYRTILLRQLAITWRRNENYLNVQVILIMLANASLLNFDLQQRNTLCKDRNTTQNFEQKKMRLKLSWNDCISFVTINPVQRKMLFKM